GELDGYSSYDLLYLVLSSFFPYGYLYQARLTLEMSTNSVIGHFMDDLKTLGLRNVTSIWISITLV
ncbi:hypothetical protein, partial [Thermaerobacillus caldiproteolyticus]|uniref:hypothetical protein n=1 Tax=Thermaerobacillus caldiproteolyticus TaxID=247480 RepID=UPI001F17F96F